VLIACDVYAVRKGLIKPEAAQDDTQVQMKLSDIKRLPLDLWVICLICVFCYTAIFPFIGIAKNFFEVKYGYGGDEASNYISLYQFTSAGASPVIGALVDSVGRNTLWLIAASSCFILVHIAFMALTIPAYVMMPAMGIFYSFLVSGLWPSVPWVVPENVVGFSYGVMTALQNAGLAIFPLVTGAVLDVYTVSSNSTHAPTHDPKAYMSLLVDSNSSSSSGALPELEGFKLTEILFMCSAGVSLVASIALLIIDKRGNGVLSSPASERRQRDEMRKREREALLNQAESDTANTLKTQEPLA